MNYRRTVCFDVRVMEQTFVEMEERITEVYLISFNNMKARLK